MWSSNWRQMAWSQLSLRENVWDCLIIGGGITGAGILREATRLGLKAVLVEQKDFAYGTSSRSSKLVHGGLRYLREGRLGLTRASVVERDKLQEAAPGLVDPLGFLFANYKSNGGRKEKLLMQAGLSLYDLLALQWSHRYYGPRDFQLLAPHLNTADLAGGFRYEDAQTDDARLTLRVIREAVQAGATAVNYVSAVDLLRENGQVVGAKLHDNETGNTHDVRARLVINATGAWADQLRQKIGHERKMRPLRGSHLIFAPWRLPIAQAVTFTHPRDSRPVFVFPWDGVTLVGTTDLDHQQDLNLEPHISGEEVAYLMEALTYNFPSLNLALDDIMSTFAGVRSVIDTGQSDPSKESRDHVVWAENGLLTVTGGKLTTFRLIAQDALRAARDLLPDLPAMDKETPTLNITDDVILPQTMDPDTQQRLVGRYGAEAMEIVTMAEAHELSLIPGTAALWAELRWSARAEGVVHLEDLLLRRVRLGLLLPEGGAGLETEIRAIVQTELGWDDSRWQAEWTAYRKLWLRHYSLPPREEIPDWRKPPTAVEEPTSVATGRPWSRFVLVVALVLGLATAVWLWQKKRKNGD
jgi:glycerol-3-phosphate dehydrogenase